MPNYSTMVFTETSFLSEENQVTVTLKKVVSRKALREYFLSSLRDMREDFISFCAKTDLGNEPDYRLYSLRAFAPFRFAFCEKAVTDETVLTIVYLSESVSEFHSLMSPIASVCKNTTTKVIAEILHKREMSLRGILHVSPDALLYLNKTPHLLNTLISKKFDSELCDPLKLTLILIKQLKELTAFSEVKFEIKHEHYNSTSIKVQNPDFDTRLQNLIYFSTNAYVYMMSILLSFLASLSSTRKLTVCTSYFSYGVEVKVSTDASRIPATNEKLSQIGTIDRLGKLFPSHGDILRLFSIIAYISETNVSVLHFPEKNELSVILGIGFDYQMPPSYKYNDPYDKAEEKLTEALGFIELLSD